MENIKFIYNKDKKIKFNSNRSEQQNNNNKLYKNLLLCCVCKKNCLTLMIQSKRKTRKNSNEWKIVFLLLLFKIKQKYYHKFLGSVKMLCKLL